MRNEKQKQVVGAGGKDPAPLPVTRERGLRTKRGCLKEGRTRNALAANGRGVWKYALPKVTSQWERREGW